MRHLGYVWFDYLPMADTSKPKKLCDNSLEYSKHSDQKSREQIIQRAIDANRAHCEISNVTLFLQSRLVSLRQLVRLVFLLLPFDFWVCSTRNRCEVVAYILAKIESKSELGSPI